MIWKVNTEAIYTKLPVRIIVFFSRKLPQKISSTAIVKDIINDIVTQIKSPDNFLDDIDKTLIISDEDEDEPGGGCIEEL